jgi:DNA ligase-1
MKDISFDTICRHLLEIENTRSRNDRTELLANLLKLIPEEFIKEFIYILDGRISPRYIKSDFNIGSKRLIIIFSKVFNIPKEEVSGYFRELGDVGLLFFNLKKNEKTTPTKLSEIIFMLNKITQIHGKSANLYKEQELVILYNKVTQLEGRFLSRIFVGNLRMGFSDKTILDALSFSLGNDKSKRTEIESAYAKCSDLGIVASKVLFDFNSLNLLSVVPGIPLFAKLVERSKTVDDGIKRFKNVMVQPKFDGLRCQVHITGEGEIKFYSRELYDMTDMFPEITKSFSKFNDIKSAIFDSEVVGMDNINNKYLAFQETMQRKRKYEINSFVTDIPLSIYIFDIIYLNGKSLLDVPLVERFKILEDIFRNSSYANIKVAETKDFTDSVELYDYFKKCLYNGLEGVVIKNPESLYKPGTRNFDWLKLKRSSLKGVVDTIDAVIMGYFKGGGSRSKFGIGAVLVGIYNKNKNRVESISKVGSGFSEKQLVEMKKQLDSIKESIMPADYYVKKDMYPDVWVSPKVVVEIRSDEITKSPTHTACEDNKNRGFALRFPRIINVRSDKTFYDTTDEKEIKMLYKMQKG